METREFKVGQTVRHSRNFIGTITKISSHGGEVDIKITKILPNCLVTGHTVGNVYIALASRIAEIIGDTAEELLTKENEEMKALINKLTTEIEELTQQKEVVEVEVDQFKFKGTVDDLEKTMRFMTRFAELTK